jgi:hypothetical protein
MKNVTFINGPLHNTDRILEDDATVYKCFELPKIDPVGNFNVAPTKPVLPIEHTYKESKPNSNIFMYEK